MAGRIFIFGAGASREDTKNEELPMPLSNDFFKSEYLKEHWTVASGLNSFPNSSLAVILSHYFGLKVIGDGADLHVEGTPNIEEVYSFLDSFENIYSAVSFERELFFKARKELLHYLANVILYTPKTEDFDTYRLLFSNRKIMKRELRNLKKKQRIFKTHSIVASLLEKRDTIITFNWDLLFETVLALYEKHWHYFEKRDIMMNPFAASNKNPLESVTLRPKYESEGYFLKLHGSVNMVNCTNINCIRNQFPFVVDFFDAEVPETLHCTVCGSPVEILIVPPNIKKTYKANRFFQLQANLASDKLQSANEIIVIGYSFPTFDFDANTLLRLVRLDPRSPDDFETTLEKVTIVNPEVNDEAYVLKVKKLFGIEHAERTHGHKIEIMLFDNIDDYMENGIKGRNMKTRNKVLKGDAVKGRRAP